MGMSGRSIFLDAVAENPAVTKYVQLFRMPLFLTMLDEELKQYGDAAWETAEPTASSPSIKVMSVYSYSAMIVVSSVMVSLPFAMDQVTPSPQVPLFVPAPVM